MGQGTLERSPEADRLREAIREHRRRLRPSARREADDELYRALGPEQERPAVHVCPPSSYQEAERTYYDSPY